MEINVLGTIYKIEYNTVDEDLLLETLAGYMDVTTKKIIIRNYTEEELDRPFNVKDLGYEKNKVIRHEIIHAFLNESGLNENSNGCNSWANNEEMIDWFALQSPKIYKIYIQLGIL